GRSRGHVCQTCGRTRAYAHAVQENAYAIHADAAGGDTQNRCRSTYAAAGHFRTPARSDSACPRLFFFATLPLCRRAVLRAKARAHGRGVGRAPVCLLPPDSDRSQRNRMMQDRAQSRSRDPLLKVKNLVVEYAVGAKTIHAVSGVSLEVGRGETLGLVGESGCGKSTLGRAVLQLRRAVSGRVLFDGQDLTAMQGDSLRKMRQRV